MTLLVRSPKSLGDALRRARREAGLTQAELGRCSGLRQATISGLENGDGATLDTLFAVLTALRLDVELGPRSDSVPALEDLF